MFLKKISGILNSELKTSCESYNMYNVHHFLWNQFLLIEIAKFRNITAIKLELHANSRLN